MLGGSKFGFSIAKKIINITKNFNEDFIFFGYKDFKQDNVTSYKFKENFLEYLKVSKAVIILSGHNTPSEAIVFKKPALVFPFKNYIEHYVNVHNLENLALVKHIHNGIKEHELESYIKELLANKEKLKKNLRKININKNGTLEAVNIIIR